MLNTTILIKTFINSHFLLKCNILKFFDDDENIPETPYHFHIRDSKTELEEIIRDGILKLCEEAD